MLERTAAWCDPLRLDTDPYPEDTPVEEVETAHQPNVITSRIADGLHAPVIDVDLPIAVVPSSTPGHFHLYIDKAMTFEQYEAILEAMVAAGVVQPGFLDHTRARRFSVVRMPWVNKVKWITDETGDWTPAPEERF